MKSFTHGRGGREKISTFGTFVETKSIQTCTPPLTSPLTPPSLTSSSLPHQVLNENVIVVCVVRGDMVPQEGDLRAEVRHMGHQPLHLLLTLTEALGRRM